MKKLSLKAKLISSYLCIGLITGVACVIAISYIESIHQHGIEVGEKLAPLGDAAMEIKLSATTAHLIYEEILGGDVEEDISIVWQLLDEALFYANVVLNGGENDEGIFYASKDENVRNKIKEVIEDVNVFITIAKTRHKNRKSTVGFDQEADNNFDRSFEKFIATADEAEELIHDSMDEGIAHLNRNSTNARRHMVIIFIIAIVTAISIGIFMTKSLTGSIDKCSNLTDSIAQGNLRNYIELANISKDEMGDLASSLNSMVTELKTLISEISFNSSSLSSTSTVLDSLSTSFSTGVTEISSRTNIIATATEEMSANINSNSNIMEQAATNVELVAIATTQMTSTVNEIAQNSAKARSITEDAVTKANEASHKIEKLGDAASQIGLVTEAITEISEQTNLLALNATIEAARAGEAGKGFAVVANEIKTLARQTADATQDIKAKISNVQENTLDAVATIEDVSSVINTVYDIISSIATIIEEQSNATDEIGNNVSQMSAGIQEVTGNVAQNSIAADEISKDINTVGYNLAQFSENSVEISFSASTIAGMVKKLNDLTSRFQV